MFNGMGFICLIVAFNCLLIVYIYDIITNYDTNIDFITSLTHIHRITAVVKYIAANGLVLKT